MRVGTVCYATEQGIGHLPRDFHRHGVITDVAIMHHASRTNHREWYPGAPYLTVRPFANALMPMLRKVDVMFFVETPFDWTLLQTCKSLGIRTAIMPMYECTPRRRPFEPDRWICPSKLDCEYFPNSPYVPVPVEYKWTRRTRARRFLHNGGNLGLRGHKGTLEILKAMKYVKSDLQLTVRAQDEYNFRGLVARCPWIQRDKRVTIQYGSVPYEHLFDDHDVFVMAEKYNGLSLPLAEARAAGMLVVTSDRFPMNDWLPQWPLIPVNSYSRQCVSGAYLEYDEAHLLPQDIAAKLDSLYDTDITAYSESGLEYAAEHSWDRLKPKWLEALA